MKVLALLALLAGLPRTEFADYCAGLVGGRGAIAVMELSTGLLLAATDPQMLCSSRYPPGSVAKLVTGLAGLEKGLELEDDFCCQGLEIVDDDTVYCSVRDGHGKMDFAAALTQSCNLYFMNLGKDLDPGELTQAYLDLGLDERVGVDLPGEAASIICTPGTDSAKLAMGIGQGASIQLTPVAMLALISGFATHGQIIRPRITPGPARLVASIPDRAAVEKIRPLLREVVGEGTGSPADVTSTTVAGKTGTSTVLGSWRTHGWFAGFAPYDSPRIALVVFLELGQGRDAALLAGKVFSAYFRGAYAER